MKGNPPPVITPRAPTAVFGKVATPAPAAPVPGKAATPVPYNHSNLPRDYFSPFAFRQ